MKLSEHNKIIRSKYYLLKDESADIECDSCESTMRYVEDVSIYTEKPLSVSIVKVYCPSCLTICHKYYEHRNH